MRRYRRNIPWVVMVVAFSFSGVSFAFAAAETRTGTVIHDLSLSTLPGRYTSVAGDSGKFRELHWMNTGYVAGATDFSVHATLEDDITLESEAHAIVDENDYEFMMEIKKEDLWFIKGEYTEFRKYFDTTGGFYKPFTGMQMADTDKDLRLDIGKIELEAGVTPKNFPDITLFYEREFKKGAKSRLTWTSLYGNPGSTTSRKIGPSWQDIDEVVNKFDIKMEDDVAGFHWDARQGWEFVRSSNMRKEQNYSVNSTANEIFSRNQFTEPRSDLITSELNVDKWFKNEKVYTSSGFRFSQINSRELENIFELNSNDIPANHSTFAEQVRDSYSDNLFTTNTWVGSVMSALWEPFTVILRGKAETISRQSASTYMKDKSPNGSSGLVAPDGRVDQIDVNDNSEKAVDWGQGLSLRFAGIPGVAIYNDYDFEQVRNNLNEERTSSSASERFSREDITHMFRSVYTLGARATPWDKATLTAQGRHRDDDVRYNHVTYSNDSGNQAKSVFIDAQYITTDELSSKLTWKPYRWLQPAIRYQLQDRKYVTWGLNDSGVGVTTKQISSIYTADLVSQPFDDLLTMFSVSYQDAKIITQARESGNVFMIPSANMDVLSALFSGVWSINDKLSFTGTAQYSKAANFNDYSAIGMPYSSDFIKTDVTAGLEWQINKTVQLEPKYAFYAYRGDPDSNPGDYNAHMVMLEVKVDWI